MSARVLIVDDLFPNVKLLETKLGLEYFDTLAAMNGPDAIAICEKGLCDLVLLDVMMPGMDGFEVCRHLKSNPVTAHIPVVMVTALDQPSDRLRGLDAGADDFLTKPVDDTALFCRVRSLVRLKAVTDELRQRALASREFGIGDPLALATAETGLDARILLVEDRPGSAERLAGGAAPAPRRHDRARPAGGDSASRPRRGFDLALVSLDLDGFDGLRLCSQLRVAGPHPRHAADHAGRGARPRPGGARPRFRRARLPDAPGRPQRADGPGPHPGEAQALHGGAAGRDAGLPADGRHRRADRPAQPALPRQPSRRAVRRSGATRARRSPR